MRERTGTAKKVKALADELPGWWRLAELRAKYDAAHPGANTTVAGKHCTSGTITHLLAEGTIEKRRIADDYASRRTEARFYEYRFVRRTAFTRRKVSATEAAWRAFRKSLVTPGLEVLA